MTTAIIFCNENGSVDGAFKLVRDLQCDTDNVSADGTVDSQ